MSNGHPRTIVMAPGFSSVIVVNASNKTLFTGKLLEGLSSDYTVQKIAKHEITSKTVDGISPR